MGQQRERERERERLTPVTIGGFEWETRQWRINEERYCGSG